MNGESDRLVEVELLHTEGCPHALSYLPRLRLLLGVVGGGRVHTVLVADGEQARRLRFLGSPTVRIEGRDVDPTAHLRSDYGLSCRLYPRAGGIGTEPPDQWVLDALRNAAAARAARRSARGRDHYVGSEIDVPPTPPPHG